LDAVEQGVQIIKQSKRFLEVKELDDTMRKVILYMMMTVDGFISGRNREIDWMVSLDDEKGIEMGFIDQVDAALIGHGSYKDMAGYWAAAENPATPKQEVEFAKK
jgi:hypothetical protein